MIKTLFLCRHGCTSANEKNLWEGACGNSLLTMTGITQAKNMGIALKDIKFDIFYCSTQARSFQTALYATQQLEYDIPVVKMKNLSELNFGMAESKTTAWINDRFEGKADQFFNATRDTWNLAFPGFRSESKRDGFIRIHSALLEICFNAGVKIGVVTHAGLLNSLAIGLQLEFDYRNCAINKLYFDTETLHFFVD